MTIWDLHVHLSGVSGRTPHERMAQLIELADRMGIERLCVYMGMPWSRDPSPEKLREENDQVLEALSHWHHRAFGFVYLNPKHVEASLAELDRCVAKGPMVGVKLWVAKECRAPELDPIIKRAAELKAVIFQHTWFKAAGNDPGELAGLLVTKAYHDHRGDTKRRTVLIPDSAHGTNPASVRMAGMNVRALPSNANGRVDLDALDRALDDSVALLMLTNPNTLGLFETDIEEISKQIGRAHV